MTAEYLLESMGLIDDDLIQDAEVRSASRPSSARWRQWSALAACLAVVVALGYGASRLPMDHKSSASPSADAAAGTACSSASMESGAAQKDFAYSNSAAGASSVVAGSEHPEADWLGFRVLVTVDGLTYAYNHTYPPTEDHGPWVETLPEGCRGVGTVVNQENDLLLPHTDTGVYVGCPLWLEGEGRGSTLYLELPQGGYLVCEYSQTYDFSRDGKG